MSSLVTASRRTRSKRTDWGRHSALPRSRSQRALRALLLPPRLLAMSRWSSSFQKTCLATWPSRLTGTFSSGFYLLKDLCLRHCVESCCLVWESEAKGYCWCVVHVLWYLLVLIIMLHLFHWPECSVCLPVSSGWQLFGLSIDLHVHLRSSWFQSDKDTPEFFLEGLCEGWVPDETCSSAESKELLSCMSWVGKRAAFKMCRRILEKLDRGWQNCVSFRSDCICCLMAVWKSYAGVFAVPTRRTIEQHLSLQTRWWMHLLVYGLWRRSLKCVRKSVVRMQTWSRSPKRRLMRPKRTRSPQPSSSFLG